MGAMESAPQPIARPGWVPPAPIEGVPGAPAGPDETEEPTGVVVVEHAIRVTAGLAALAIAAATDALRRTMPAPPPSDEPAVERTDPVALAAGALLGLTLLAGESVARVVGGVARAVGPPASWIAGVPPLGPASAWVRSTATTLDERWRDTRPGAEAAASAFTRELVPQVVDAVLDQLDLTWLVAERVDIDELVARVDLERVVARVDVDAIVDRLDLNEIASRIDVEAVIAGVDLDAIAQRLDVEAVIDRIDLAGIARSVIDEIDLPEIIRESTGSMASETVRGVRIQGIEADAAVSRAVDRVLLRRRSRETDAPGEPESSVNDAGAPGASDEAGPST
jgi:hypothetical protein